MTTAIKETIDLELATIRGIAEDETAGKEELKVQLEKAGQLHKVLETAYENAYALCSDIESWISEEEEVT